ncbi:MAG: BspA family leucine-rich repeat surface protein [Lachnospiraceae bacterium]|nr:BspA family leucine-rich repeat surface protein [Lachnospiraceae bacterium]
MMEKRFRGFRSRNGLHLSENNYITNADFRNRKGFTLVELIVVLVILAILAAIAVPVGLGFLDRAREKRVVSNAEASMTATQTILNDSYNGGLGCIPLSSRDKARDMAKSVAENPEEFEMGTKFKIWTVKTWTEDGEVRSTDKYAGYFTTQYALFENTDGKVAFYNGKEWNVFDSLDKITDSVYSNLSSEDAIVIWPATGSDKASNPHMGDDETLVWEEDSSSNSKLQVVLQLKGNASDPDKLLFSESNSPAAPSWQQNKEYSSEDSFKEWLNKWINPQNITVENRRYTKDELVWEYTNRIDPVRPDENRRVDSTQLLSIIENWAETEETNLTFTAVPKGKLVPVSVSVSAVDENTLTVTNASVSGLLDLTEGEYGEYKTDNLDTYSNHFENDLNSVSVSTNNNNENKDSISWDNAYRLGDSKYEAALTTVVQNEVRTQVASYINKISADLDRIDLDYKAAANLNKKVLLKGRDDNTPVLFVGGENNNAKSFLYEFSKNEVEAGIYYHGNAVCSVVTEETAESTTSSIVGLNEKQLFDNAGIHYPEGSKQRPKSWTIYDCNADFAAQTEGSPSETFNNPMKTSLEHLFTESNGVSFRELAVVDVSAMNSRLDASANDSARTPVWDDFYWLINGNKNGSTDDTNRPGNVMSKITSIDYVLLSDYYSKSASAEREICLSTQTTDVEKDGNRLKRSSDGQIVPLTRTNKDYPCYIVACCLHNTADDTYKIYVATEDDTEMKAIRSLRSMFADCTSVETNTMINVVDISEVTSTRDMFKDNHSLNSTYLADLPTNAVQDMSYMFKNCHALNQSMISHIDNAASIESMYAGCGALKTVTICGSSSDVDSPLLNPYTKNVFAGTQIENITIQNIKFTEFTENDITHKETVTKVVRDTLTNGLYNLMHSAVTATVPNTNNRTLQKVVFHNVICPNLETTRELFSQVSANEEVLTGTSSLKYVDLSGLSVPNNTSTRRMFYCCNELAVGSQEDQKYLNLGNIIPANPTQKLNMSSMFGRCSSLETTKIAGLDTSNGKYLDWLFERCTSLTGEEEVCIKNAESISRLFLDCSNLKKVRLYGGAPGERPNCPLYTANTNNDDSMDNIFANCSSLETLEIENLNFTRLTSMEFFFKIKEVEDISVATSDVRKNLRTAKFNNLSAGTQMTSMANLFSGAAELQTVDLTNLSFTNVNNVSGMFNGCENLVMRSTGTGGSVASAGLYMDATLITDKVKDMSSMFKGCAKLDLTQEILNNLTPTYATGANCTSMFEGCTALKGDAVGDNNVIEFDITYVKNISSMFKSCKNLDKVVLKGQGFEKASVLDSGDSAVFTDSTVKHLVIRDVYLANIKNGTTPYGTSDPDMLIKKLFTSSKNTLETANLTNVQFSNQYPTMTNFFQKYTKLTSVEFNHVKMPNMGRMKQMFQGCTALQTVKFSGFDAPNAWNFSYMFDGCTSLQSIDFGNVGGDGELHTKTTGHNTDFNNTFNNCKALTEIKGIEKFDTSNAENMTNMFYNCLALEELDLSSFDISGITNDNKFANMFGTEGISNLTRIYASENFDVRSDTIEMFGKGLTSLEGGAGTVFNASYTKSNYAHLDGGEENPGYFFEKPHAAKLKFEKGSDFRDSLVSLAQNNNSKIVKFLRNDDYTSAKQRYDELSNNPSTQNRTAIWSSNTTVTVPTEDNPYTDVVYAYSEIDENGNYVIYWFCRSPRVYLEGDYSRMFSYGLDPGTNQNQDPNQLNLYNLNDVSGIKDFDFSGVTSLRQAFKCCTSLNKIEFDSNLSNCGNFHQMCERCESLVSITNRQDGNLHPTAVNAGTNKADCGFASVFNHCKNLQDISFFKNANVHDCGNICKMFNDTNNAKTSELFIEMLATWTIENNDAAFLKQSEDWRSVYIKGIPEGNYPCADGTIDVIPGKRGGCFKQDSFAHN